MALFKMGATGLVNEGQVKKLEDLARQWSQSVGNLSTTEGVGFLTDVLRITGSPDHVFTSKSGTKMSPDAIAGLNQMAGTMSYMKAYNADKSHGSNEELFRSAADAIRSAELVGRGTHLTDIAGWMDKLVRIQIGTGVSPTAFLTTQRNAGISFLTMSDDSIIKFATMIQEQGGATGVMAATGFMHMIGGGSQTVRGNEALRSLGILPNDPKVLQKLAQTGKIDLNKKGQISRVNDTELFKDNALKASDPYAWYSTTLLDGLRKKMKAKGIDIDAMDPKHPSVRSTDAMIAIGRELGAAFKNRNEAKEAVEAIIQMATINKRTANIKRVVFDKDSMAKNYDKMVQDFGTQMTEMKVSLGKIFMPLVSTIMPMLNKILGGVAGFMESLGPLGSALAGLGIIRVGGGLLVGLMKKYPMFRIAAMLGIGAAGGGSLMHMLMGGMIVRGLSGGALAGGGMAAMAGGGSAAAGLGLWAARLVKLKSLLGLATRLFGIIGVISAIGSVGSIQSWAGALWARVTKAKDAEKKWAEANKLLTADAEWIFGKDRWTNFRKNWMKDPTLSRRDKSGPLERYDKYMNSDNFFSRKREWEIKRQPYGPKRSEGLVPLSLVHQPRTFLDRLGSFFNGPFQGGKGKGGPTQVVVTQMPRQEQRPNVVNVGGVTVHVTTNASGGEIGGAVGAAVGSNVSNALGDQH
ncbi:MAG: hypothetical protein HOP09_04850 [Hyphomicrobium sp.]|nr:hypothetical protein [Hyphomicrobium sp.]